MTVPAAVYCRSDYLTDVVLFQDMLLISVYGTYNLCLTAWIINSYRHVTDTRISVCTHQKSSFQPGGSHVAATVNRAHEFFRTLDILFKV